MTDLYFLIPAVIVQFLNPIAELAIPIEISTKQKKKKKKNRNRNTSSNSRN